MTVQPIIEAEDVLVSAIRDALSGLVGEMPDGRPKLFYLVADEGAAQPLAIFQLQSDIQRLDRIGGAGATTLVTLRANAASAKAARAYLNSIAPGMDTLTYPGYEIQARYHRTPPPLFTGTAYQAAHIWRVNMERV